MKRRNNCSFFSNLLVPLFLFFSCGIDYYIYLYPVVDRNPDPCTSYENPETYDKNNNFFGFKTRDSVNSPISNYQGYMVYYRIYNNSDTMLSDMNYINNYNSNDDYKANIISYIENRNFKRLYCENQSFAAPLINKSNSDRTVKIRLVSEQDYGTGITINDVLLGTPIRNISSSPYKPEYFFDTDKFSQEDTDISFTQGDVNFEDVDTWYVSAYVLTYGIDDVYSPVYSSALWLGCSVIKVDEEDKS